MSPYCSLPAALVTFFTAPARQAQKVECPDVPAFDVFRVNETGIIVLRGLCWTLGGTHGHVK